MAKADDEILKRLDRIEGLLTEMSVSFLNLSNRIAELEDRGPQGGGGLLRSALPPEAGGVGDDDDDLTEVSADELLEQFSDQIAKVAAREDSTFSLGDVEVDMGATMGSDGERVMLGANHRRAATPETATRLKFTLRRRMQAQIADPND